MRTWRADENSGVWATLAFLIDRLLSWGPHSLSFCQVPGGAEGSGGTLGKEEDWGDASALPFLLPPCFPVKKVPPL